MEHPSKDVAYILSYPRSGSGWFRYCLKFITNADASTTSTEIADAVYDNKGRHCDSEFIYHSHLITNFHWDIENCFDVKNILLLRNYKEAIFSEMKNVYNRPSLLGHTLQGSSPILRYYLLACSNSVEVLKHIAAKFDPNLRKIHPDDWLRIWNDMLTNQDHPSYQNPVQKLLVGALPKNEMAIMDTYSTLKADQIFDDFMLSGFPISKTLNHSLWNAPEYVIAAEMKRYPIEASISFSIANHYHFALQLKRYYDLLEYHDKVSKINPNNALVVKYENFMQDPFSELNKVIDFIEETSLIISEHISVFRDNLCKLMDNIEHHKHVSINKYKAPSIEEGRRMNASSYGKDNNKYNFHSSQCRKQFLVEIDNVLKNKNLELFNKYLSDYEEKGD